jgi:hypothetical protein
METAKFAGLKTVFVRGCHLANESTVALLGLLAAFSKGLENLVLSQVECTEEVAGLVRRLLEGGIRILIYDDARISTKLFCLMAIGLGESNTIVDVRMRKNYIDSRATRAIQTLLRYIKTLQVLDLSGSRIPEKEVKSILADMKDKRKRVRLK